MSRSPLLEVKGLTKYFPVRASGQASQAGRKLRAVNNVTLSLDAGKTLGLVGESGCGKSTTGRLILRLIEPTGGSVTLDGVDVLKAGGRELKAIRRRMQIVFQDPLGSLNPRLNIAQLLSEPLVVHGIPAREHRDRMEELMTAVELPMEMLRRYPHEFSGGQRQRIAIARALALKPDIIIADEPVSALDASIQSQILMLLKNLQEEFGLSYLFISHDLAVVRFICHEVAVMYFGEIVEQGPVEELYNHPAHPYTESLLQAIPKPDPASGEVKPLSGQLPDATDPPLGCPFASRCAKVMQRCRMMEPPSFEVGENHTARCWLNDKQNKTSG